MILEIKLAGEELRAEVVRSEWVNGQEGTLLCADVNDQGDIVAIGTS
jgi:hypothetical protein